MSSTTSTTYDWLKKIPSSIVQLDEIPLLGHPPPFSWEDFAAAISQNLELKDLKIEPAEFQWRSEEDLFSGLGKALTPLTFHITPFEGKAYWVMAEKEIQKFLSSIFLTGGGSADILDSEYKEGFYHFLALEAIHAIEQIGYDTNLTPTVTQSEDLPTGPMLSMDISLTLQKKKLLGRLFISPELHQSIRGHYTQKAREAPFVSPLAEKLKVTVHLEAGSTTLTLNEWSQIKPGDFLLLDQCSLKSQGEKGKVMLTLNGSPIFRASIEDGNIKILEYPLYHEVNEAMDMHKPEEDELEEDELEEEDEDEWEEETEEETEEEAEEAEEKEEEEEEEEEEEGEEEAEETKPKGQIVTEPDERKATSPKELPLPIVVEVARLKMSVQTLMDLKPGNILELDVHPESGVNLVINGSKVGRGELLQIGETLGIRILEMG